MNKKCKPKDKPSAMKMQANISISWKHFFHYSLISLIFLPSLVISTHEDCPWYQRDDDLPNELKSNCICATNPSSDNQLSVQCQDINAQTLVAILSRFQAGTQEQPLELLYLNGSQVTDSEGMLFPKIFGDLHIVSLQLSGCKIKSVHEDSFVGTENYLKHISLSQNEITVVPTAALQNLQNLSLLDLSNNKITKIPHGAFHKLNKLATLKLNDNNIELHPTALVGLETSLRNLNLKGTRISHVPEAITNLSSLAFLDLAQNRLRELEPKFFVGLNSLTALNLERNLLQTLPDSVFEGINDTLSSLSLLNNLITNYPRGALKNLHELRVLDLGFNLLTEIPKNAFYGLKTLTLLALDGNPLATLPEEAFVPLNTTLRGISLGGRFFTCDCRLKWILEWIQEYDLQVTSRERNPQFCGSPTELRKLNFYQIQPEDLTCTKNETKKMGEYDVKLSPADIALLGMGSSSVYVSSQKESESLEDSSSQERETSENKTTLQVEVPDRVQKNVTTTVKFKPRRTRPPKFTKIPNPTTTSTTTEHIMVKVNTESSEENNSKEVSSSSVEDQDNNKHLTSYNKFSSGPSSQIRDEVVSSTTPITRIPLVISTRSPVRNPPIRPNILRHRIDRISSKVISTTTTTRETPTTNTLKLEESLPTTTTSKEFITVPTVSVKVASPKSIVSSKIYPMSKTIDALDIGDENIPVISGIGSAVSSPNLHTGSIMSVKQPSVQTQNTNTGPTNKALDTMYPSFPQHVPSGRYPVPPNLIFADKSDIVVKEILRNGDSVALYWESQNPRQAAGFRIIYRLFGEDTFRHGPPLAATETEYRIKNVPHNECIVVCVVPYEEILYNEISPSAASVPPGSQCREVKPISPSSLMNHMDKITIGASAAICVTVFIAVLIFIGITKRAKTKRPLSTLMTKEMVTPSTYQAPSPGTTMGNSAMGGYGHHGTSKEWDQMSMVSTKSIPRARVYHGSMDGLANMPPLKTATINPHFHRGCPEGLATHRSFSAHQQAHHHHHNIHNHNYPQHAQGNGHQQHGSAAFAVNNYLNNQNRLLRTSLGSRASYDALNKLASTRHSNHQLEHFTRKRSSRLNQSESLNTLNGYETPDNWTDHDMDFYVARNHTHSRHDLVQL